MKLALTIVAAILGFAGLTACNREVAMKGRPRTIKCDEYDTWVVSGRWVWSRKTQSYRWVSGYRGPRRSYAYWVDGHWTSSPKGRRYVPGRWQ